MEINLVRGDRFKDVNIINGTIAIEESFVAKSLMQCFA